MILHTKTGPLELDDVTIQSLKKTWPTKDLEQELAKMHLWLLAHERQRPVRLWTFVRNWLKKAPDVTAPPPPIGAGWWKSEAMTLELGQSLGLSPRPGEEMFQFRERVGKILAERRDRNLEMWLPKVRSIVDSGMKS